MHVAQLQVAEAAEEVRASHEPEVVDGDPRREPVARHESDERPRVLGDPPRHGGAARAGSEHGPVGLHVGLATVEERARGLGSERPVPLRVVGDEVGSRDVRVTAGQRQRRAHADRIHRRGEDPHQ